MFGLKARLLVLAAVLLSLAVVWERPGDRRLFPASNDAETVEIWLIDNGLHTDLVLPADRLRARGGATARALTSVPSTAWVAVGWGDWRFYRESGISLPRAADGLRSLFLPGNRSVVMLDPLPTDPTRYYGGRPIRVRLTRAGFERLAARLDGAFAGVSPRLAEGPQPRRARFYEGRQTFSVLRLCNHWTADLLHAAGLPTRPVLSTLGSGLAADLRGRAGVG